MRKVSIVVDGDGKVVASYITPRLHEVPFTPDETPSSGLLASEGQEVIDLELPDEEVPPEPGPDFLETLQRHKDQAT
jgi:hypothetical protein